MENPVEIIAFNKAKFDVFMAAVTEEFKSKPTITNLVIGLLQQAHVPIQIQPPEPVPTPNFEELDSNKPA